MRSHNTEMTKIGFDPRPLDDIGTDAVQRILDALGSGVTSASLDKEDLAAELGCLVAAYRGRVVGADRGLAKDRETRMTNIRKAARQIVRELNKDAWSLISSTRANRANPYREEPHATMERLIEDIGDWFDPPDRVPSPPGSTWGARPSRSPFEELVATMCPTVHSFALSNVSSWNLGSPTGVDLIRERASQRH